MAYSSQFEALVRALLFLFAMTSVFLLTYLMCSATLRMCFAHRPAQGDGNRSLALARRRHALASGLLATIAGSYYIPYIEWYRGRWYDIGSCPIHERPDTDDASTVVSRSVVWKWAVPGLLVALAIFVVNRRRAEVQRTWEVAANSLIICTGLVLLTRGAMDAGPERHLWSPFDEDTPHESALGTMLVLVGDLECRIPITWPRVPSDTARAARFLIPPLEDGGEFGTLAIEEFFGTYASALRLRSIRIGDLEVIPMGIDGFLTYPYRPYSIGPSEQYELILECIAEGDAGRVYSIEAYGQNSTIAGRLPELSAVIRSLSMSR